MKHSFFLCLLLLCANCLTSPSNETKTENVSVPETEQTSRVETNKEFTKTFKEFGFSIKTPCVLEDVSSQVNGDFAANFGGVDNQDDSENMTAYQVAVIKIPIGIEDYSEAEKNEFIDEQLSNRMASFSSVKRVLFSDNEYIGYVGDTHHNGLKQRGVMFNKDRYIIGLTVMTNSDLDRKFNKFTNSFKVLD